MAETTKAPAPKKAAAKAAKTGAADAKVKKAGPGKSTGGKAAPAKSAKKATAPRQPESRVPFDRMVISDEQRYRMIAEAAYFRAESRGFQSDHVRDWIEAERDIAILLGEDK
jgi:hypothetical protein